MLDVSWSSGILEQDHKYSTDFAHGYVVCLLEDDSVVEAIKFLSGDAIPKAVRALGKDHATVIELRFCYAYAMYHFHFFGHGDYRGDLMKSIRRHIGVLARSARVLGIEHPTTQGIGESLRLCFDVQLDWSIEDIPAELLAVRPLLEDFDEDLADQLASIVDSDDERDTLEFALAHQARRRREKKERRDYNAKAVADFSRSQWKKGTRRKKVESPDAIVVP